MSLYRRLASLLIVAFCLLGSTWRPAATTPATSVEHVDHEDGPGAAAAPRGRLDPGRLVDLDVDDDDDGAAAGPARSALLGAPARRGGSIAGRERASGRAWVRPGLPRGPPQSAA